MHRFSISTLSLLLLFGNVFAQDDKINPDRPDQTNAPFVLNKYDLQFELGVNMIKSRSGDKDFFLPTVLTRFGLFSKAELRIATTIDHYPVTSSAGTNAYQTGLQPVGIGAKIALVKEKKWFPETAVIFNFAFPTLASKDLQADKLAPNFVLSMQNTISKKWSVAYNLGAVWDGFNPKPAYTYSASFGCDVAENWDAFVEVFGSALKDDSPDNDIDAGLGYYVNSNFKVDLSTGVGISNSAPAWFVSLGASFRFKTHH